MTSTSLHSICIPTFNRADLLREAITNALSQSNPNIEVLVSDNASTDHTQAVVRSFNDARLKYHRHPSNIGPVPNFLSLLEMASGEYMSWLQDDDLIVGWLSERAVGQLSQNPDCAAYVPFTFASYSKHCVHAPIVHGPPFPIDWTSLEPTKAPGLVFIPLLLFHSPGIPPTMVFRREWFREHVSPLSFAPENYLYGERTMFASVVRDSNVLLDPRLGGVLLRHEGQGSVQAWSDVEAKFAHMANTLQTLADTAAGDCIELFAGHLPKYGWSQVLEILEDSQRWPDNLPLCRRVRGAVIEELQNRRSTPEQRERVERALNPSKLNQVARRWLPPVITELVRNTQRKFKVT
jgi:hypothetical protein